MAKLTGKLESGSRELCEIGANETKSRAHKSKWTVKQCFRAESCSLIKVANCFNLTKEQVIHEDAIAREH